MDAVQFRFATDAFTDDPATLAKNINGLTGHALATWLSGALKAHGITTSPAWAEDYGWSFSASGEGAKYLFACVIQEGEGSVVVSKSRSLIDRLTGRNRLADDDALVAATRAALESDGRVGNLSVE